MPRLIVFSLGTGYAGMDSHDFEVFPDDVTEDELSEEAWQRAIQHAESYGIYPRSDYADDEDISDEELDGEEYSDNIGGSWEDFDPKKHEGLVSGGGSATKLFERLLQEYNE